jgi:hypothetical protein
MIFQYKKGISSIQYLMGTKIIFSTEYQFLELPSYQFQNIQITRKTCIKKLRLQF